MVTKYPRGHQKLILFLYIIGSAKARELDSKNITWWKSDFLNYEFETDRLNTAWRCLGRQKYPLANIIDYLLPTRLRSATPKVMISRKDKIYLVC